MTNFILAIISLIVLLKSAGVFVSQASALAKRFKIGDFVIGCTIVAFGTSLPELVISVFSATSNHPNLAISNVVGSNIANFCLILGLIATFKGYRIYKRNIDFNLPLNLAALATFWAILVWSGFRLTWNSGILLLLVFLILMILTKEHNHLNLKDKKYPKFNLFYLFSSLLLLAISGRICINNVEVLTLQLKISDTILGYFLLAIGTSLPEFVTTVVAVKKGYGELGIGNILGSNLFNLLFILGISSFIIPLDFSGFVVDLAFLTAATFATYTFAIMGKRYYFSRKEGLGLLFIYLIFALMQIIK